jgi:hypothetical protein
MGKTIDAAQSIDAAESIDVAESIDALTGAIPYRLALAGGWIDQPFVSAMDPAPPGSMVVVALQPEYRFMDLCGMATSTRKVAARIWNGRLPPGDPETLVRELYRAENEGRADPSGSQDMIGLVYPGISRLDYDIAHEGGYFPRHIESILDPRKAAWLEKVLKILPVAQRPAGYSPLGDTRISPGEVRRLAESGRLCFDSILSADLCGLQNSMNECMAAWESLLPRTVRHPAIGADLAGIQSWYRKKYGGAMYSGCGGGYLFVATELDVPGSFGMRVRLS